LKRNAAAKAAKVARAVKVAAVNLDDIYATSIMFST
jgi:hypothetical protein